MCSVRSDTVVAWLTHSPKKPHFLGDKKIDVAAPCELWDILALGRSGFGAGAGAGVWVKRVGALPLVVKQDH